MVVHYAGGDNRSDCSTINYLFAMDTISYVALIIFGVIVFCFWVYGQHKTWFPKIGVKNFFSLDNLKFLPVHILLGGMGVVPIIIGVVGLFKQ